MLMRPKKLQPKPIELLCELRVVLYMFALALLLSGGDILSIFCLAILGSVRVLSVTDQQFNLKYLLDNAGFLARSMVSV
jgi:predicted Kef-type K+ transport protein